MTLSAAAANVATLSAMDMYKDIHSQKGYHPAEIHALFGVTITVRRGLGDGMADQKVAAMRGAIYKVFKAGFTLPATMTLYTSNVDSFKNVAYQRSMQGTRDAVVNLGGKFSHYKDLPHGVCTDVAGTDVTKYIEAVCVHEIGHVLHEIVAPEWFWSADANAPPNIPLACKISMYASLNKKEYVAEAFCGMIYGLKNTYGQAVVDEYTALNGPSSPSFP